MQGSALINLASLLFLASSAVQRSPMTTWSDSQSTLVTNGVTSGTADNFHEITNRIQKLLRLSLFLSLAVLITDGLHLFYWSRYIAPGAAGPTIIRDATLLVLISREGNIVGRLPVASRGPNIVVSSVLFLAWLGVLGVYMLTSSLPSLKNAQPPEGVPHFGIGAVEVALAVGITLSLFELVVYMAMFKCINRQREDFVRRNCPTPSVCPTLVL